MRLRLSCCPNAAVYVVFGATGGIGGALAEMLLASHAADLKPRLVLSGMVGLSLHVNN